jgi:bifunctional enzyme CysN/CysC
MAVERGEGDPRRASGRVVQGEVRPGDRVRALPSGIVTRVREVFAGSRTAEAARQGDEVTLVLDDPVGAHRGDVLGAAADPPQLADQFEARLRWSGAHRLLPGRPYLLRVESREVTASVTSIKHREDPASGARLAARTLGPGETGVVNLATGQLIAFDPYGGGAALGRFVLLDKLTGEAAGEGTIDFALRRAANVHWQAVALDKAHRAALLRQKPLCIWFTGLPASGKSTLANLLERRLHADGRHTYLLDGDNVRHGLSRDLGFTEPDRVENIRRVAEVARLMVDAGLIVIVSFISPFRAERRMARSLFADGEFVEVFVDTPLEVCARRDPKGLYAKARRGELANFTGIDSPYEAPEAAEVHVETTRMTPDECVAAIARGIE